MDYTYPHTIENGAGERITFLRKVQDDDTDYLEVENLLQPGCGAPMHTHYFQEESLTVIRGLMGVQYPGEGPDVVEEGETVTFRRGTPHRVWNAGQEPLICRGWIKPALNVEYFLTEIYRSTAEHGGHRPGAFESAYLLEKYRSEFDVKTVPSLVRHVIFPAALWLGKLQGKHKRFADAPEPVRQMA